MRNSHWIDDERMSIKCRERVIKEIKVRWYISSLSTISICASVIITCYYFKWNCCFRAALHWWCSCSFYLLLVSRMMKNISCVCVCVSLFENFSEMSISLMNTYWNWLLNISKFHYYKSNAWNQHNLFCLFDSVLYVSVFENNTVDFEFQLNNKILPMNSTLIESIPFLFEKRIIFEQIRCSENLKQAHEMQIHSFAD